MNDFEFHHGGVNVPNLEEAIQWYDHVLGFKLESRFDIPPAKAKVAFVKNGALRFEIFEKADAKPLPEERRSPQADLQTHGNKHVAFRIDNLDTFLDQMKEKNADVALVVREEFGSGCFIRDCAGNLIEFVEQPADELANT